MIDMGNREEIINKLNELKGMGLPHMTIESFRKIDKSFNERIDCATEEEREKIEKYLSVFYDDTNEDSKIHGCIFNEKQPMLTWGLAHGEMYDENTGLNWRAYHYLTINGTESRYSRIMQYHPEGYDISE